MSTAAQRTNDPRVQTVEVTNELISAHLTDGRTISVPLAWSWRLFNASAEQRQRVEIIGEGTAMRWPDVDEDISVRGMLDGIPARRPSTR